MTELTGKGRQWAEDHADESIVARVALTDGAGGWPDAHVRAAVAACNAKGDDA